MVVNRVKVTFNDEPGEGSGVARAFYTALAEALLSKAKLPNLSPAQVLKLEFHSLKVLLFSSCHTLESGILFLGWWYQRLWSACLAHRKVNALQFDAEIED